SVLAVAHVGMDLEPQLFRVERQRFVLVAHVQHDYLDTLCHGTYVGWRPFVATACSRRFSETAVPNPGRGAARTAHSGACARPCGAGRSRVRSAPGLSPVMSWNMRPKVPRLFQPVR